MQIKRYLSFIIGFLFLGVAVVLWAMPDEPGASDAVPHARPQVALARAEHAASRRTVHFAGITQACNRALLSFAVPARMVSRDVQEGSSVRAGQALARLDDREFRNALALARATRAELQTRLDQAVRDRRRAAQLAAHKAATTEELEKATAAAAALEASLQAAQARLQEARRLLGETVLRAPFSGTVTAVHMEPGEWAAPGQPAIEVSGDGPLELKVELPESMVGRLHVGQEVPVVFPFSDQHQVTGRISAVSRAAMTAGRLFPVKVAIAAQPGIRAGLTAQLRLNLVAEDALAVPLTAVVNPGGSRPAVFIYHNGQVERRPVELGDVIRDRIIVRGSIQAGDQVVVSGQSRLADGDVVEVRS